jgi:hypothetical protein
MAQDWDIKPLGKVCSGCGVAFADGQPCYSALSFGETGYTREDHCEGCWPKRLAAGGPPYSTWRSVFRLPPPPAEEPLRKETAETLLRRLIELEDERHRNVIYILAVMLERKRILAERDVQTRDDGVLIRVYEHKKTGDTFLIPDPRLLLNELDEVQQQVIEMLGKAEPQAKEAGTEPASAKQEPADATAAAPAPES